MKRKLVSMLLLTTLTFGLVGCSSVNTNDSTEIVEMTSADSEAQYKSTIQQAIDNLSNVGVNYVITNIVETPSSTVYYVENVAKEGYSFTEYPRDENGNLGIIPASADKLSYLITDWLTEDNKMYLNSSNDASNPTYYKLPDTYANINKARNVLYMDTMLNEFSSIKPSDEGTVEMDLGESDTVPITIYECILPSDKVKNYVAVGSIKLYETVKKESSSNENIKKLCDYYLDDLEDTMHFGDARVYVGIDSNNILRTYSLEVGGLGSRMYVTKTVLLNEFEEVKVPSFDNAQPYSNSIQDLADYLAESGKDYTSALNDLNDFSNKYGDSIDTSALEGIDTNTTEE